MIIIQTCITQHLSQNVCLKNLAKIYEYGKRTKCV